MRFMTYKEYEDEVYLEDIKIKLTGILNGTDTTIIKLSKDIGMAESTMRNFLRGRSGTTYKSMCKMYNYVNNLRGDDINASEQD